METVVPLISALLSFGILTAPILRSEAGPEAVPARGPLSVEKDRSTDDSSSGGSSETDTSIRKVAARRSVLPSRVPAPSAAALQVWLTGSNSAVRSPASTPVPAQLTAPDSLRLFLRGTGDDHRSPPPA